jgi:hypothetical protein
MRYSSKKLNHPGRFTTSTRKMDVYLEEVCPNKSDIDDKAKVYAYSYEDHLVHEALEMYEEEQAEIDDMLEQDFHRQLHTQDTVIEYAIALYRVRRIIFYLRERFNNANSIDSLMESFEGMST